LQNLFRNKKAFWWNTSLEVITLAKKGMKRPEINHGSKNDVDPVPEIQGRAKTTKEKAKPITEK